MSPVYVPPVGTPPVYGQLSYEQSEPQEYVTTLVVVSVPTAPPAYGEQPAEYGHGADTEWDAKKLRYEEPAHAHAQKSVHPDWAVPPPMYPAPTPPQLESSYSPAPMENASPYTDVAYPNQAPYEHAMPPYAQIVPPYVQTIPPYVPTMPPYAQPVPPYVQPVLPSSVPATPRSKVAPVDDPEPVTPVPRYSHTGAQRLPPRPGPVDADIKALVHRLSLREKIGQLAMLPVTVLLDSAGNLNITAAEYWIGKWSVGSFFDSPASAGHGRYNWYSAKSLGDFTDAVQHVAAKHGARLPVIWGIDSVRGANYVKGAAMFPAGVGLAATFSPRLAYEAGRVSAKDTRAAGYQWAFAPMQDVSVNKLWSRGYEGFGEDPFLSSEMASASVHGYQGDYKHDRTRVAACMKHFIGYGYPFNGQDRGNRHIAMHELLEYYLPPFTASVRAGAATAMESYGAINGEPVIMSNLYLQRLLREKLGFQGLLVSDAGEISSQAALYKTAANDGQATFATLNRTSIDMSMATTDLSFCMVLHELVTNGYIPESRLDESVARVLQLKKDLGLFENPFVDRALQKTVGSAQDIEDARNAARESITLLKNANGVLPLKPHDRVLFVGPTINSTRFMGGGWNVQWQGPPEARGDAVYQGHGDTVLEGVKRVTSQTPCYYEGVDIDGTMLIGIDKIIAAAKRADKVVIGLGEHTYAEKGGDIGNLALPAAQLELVYAIAELAQKPTVVVLFAGRPRILEHVPKVADAIINAYLPGAYGGLPVAEVLYGKVNPSGRLPYTYPATESQADMTVWQPAYSAYDPQWGFGYGLGYSHISYSNITLSSTTICIGAPITATVAVTNHGTMAQKETVMLFTRLPFRFDLAPENLRLRAFAKIELRPGETRTVSLHLRAEDLAYWDVDLKQRIPPSAVTLLVNPYTQPGLAASAQIVVDPTESLDSF